MFFRILIRLGLLVCVTAFGLWFWYYFFGNKPKLVFAAKVASSEAGCAFVEGDRVTVVDWAALSMFNIRTGKQVWRAPLPASANSMDAIFTKLREWHQRLEAQKDSLKSPEKVAAFNNDVARYTAELKQAQAQKARMRQSGLGSGAFDMMGPTGPALHPAGKNIWVVLRDSAYAFDLETGKQVKSVGIPGQVSRTMAESGILLVRSSRKAGEDLLTRISMADGAAQSLALASSGLAGGSAYSFASNGEATVDALRNEFAIAGDHVIHLLVQLASQRIVEKQAMKPASADDDAFRNAGPTMGATEMMNAISNDIRRETVGSTIKLDESIYQVTLQRLAEADRKPITIQVTGRPSLHVTEHLTLVSAAGMLYAFDLDNKKLWEASLGYPLPESQDRFSGFIKANEEWSPCLEWKELLFVADKGFLTALDRGTGKVKWRIPSVGIFKMEFDGNGMLYVMTANASAETLKYALQQDAGKTPLLMKIEPVSARIAWQVKDYQNVHVRGAYVYATRSVSNAQDAVERVFGNQKVPEGRFKVYCLNRQNGQPRWEFFAPKAEPGQVTVNGTRVALLFRDELQVIRSLALPL